MNRRLQRNTFHAALKIELLHYRHVLSRQSTRVSKDPCQLWGKRNHWLVYKIDEIENSMKLMSSFHQNSLKATFGWLRYLLSR